jgi:hypothetical protein
MNNIEQLLTVLAKSGWTITSFARCQLDGANKVYGVATDGKIWATFWGRFAGPYTLKVQTNKSTAETQIESKLASKYTEASVALYQRHIMPLLETANKK